MTYSTTAYLVFNRLEAYTRNAHCSRTDLTAQDYVMTLPDPQNMKI